MKAKQKWYKLCTYATLMESTIDSVSLMLLFGFFRAFLAE